MSALGTPGDGAMGLKSPVVRTFSVESVGQKSWAEYKARNVPDVVSRSPEALPSPSSSLTTSRKGHRLPVAFQLPDGRSGESKTSPNTPLRSPGSPSLTHVSTPPSASINNNNNNNNNHNSSSGNINSNDDNASLKKSSPASPGRAQYVPSCVVTVRGGDGHSEKLLFEGVAWGVVTVAMQRARQKVGRVTAAVVNQASRVLYITGPGLPVTGVPLHMAKTGFRGSLAGLEETFRNSGVKFNFDIRASPKADNTDLHALLANAQSRAGELPRCQLPTETIMTYVKRSSSFLRISRREQCSSGSQTATSW
ncbi:hypothetical protein DIPPA_13527 [Diplonema papillatum]|nr:hypothetical protein DIPPA_13527 [Diplonema papillatum]